MATAQDVLKQLRGDYDESTGYTGASNANDILKNYFASGGNVVDLTNNLTDQNTGNSIISQDLFNKLLNNYYSTVNPAALTSPQAFQQATGQVYGTNTAGSIGELPVDEQSVTSPLPQAPAGYVPYTPGQDLGAHGGILDPNNVITVNGLTYTPKSNLITGQGGDFLSKFGPALAMAGFGGLDLAGVLPGSGLIGGATGGELAGGAVGGGGLSGSAGTSALTEFLGGAGGGGSLAGAGTAAGAGALGGATAATGGTGLSGLLGTTLFTNPLTGSAVTLGGLLGNALPSLANYFTQKSNANSLQDAIDQATKLTEPFASQYPFYQNLLQQVWTNPNFFANNPATLAGANILQRQNAKLGQLYSGNAMGDIANYLSQNQLNYSNALAPLAGATIAPGQTGSNVITGQQAVNNTTGQALASLGNIFGLGGQTAQNSTLNNTINNLGNQVKNYLSNLGASTMSVP